VLVSNITAAIWEMVRYRWFKPSIISVMRRTALSSLLAYRLQIMESDDAERLSERFFSDDSARKEVLQILQKFDLDERAIEAEAMRLVLDELEKADKMLVTAERRHVGDWRLIGEYRDALAARCKQASELVEQDGTYVLRSEQED
jgi:hypothetical protein